MKIQNAKLPLRTVFSMLQTPNVLRQSVRCGIRRRMTAPMDYYLRGGYSAPPVQIAIKVTNACNLRCKMCAQWGERGYNFDRPPAALRDVVSLDVYKQMVDDIAGIKPWMYIWGGEPFLHRGILPLLAYMKEKGLVVSVVTNGTTLVKDGAALVDMGMDILMVSIDGVGEVQDRIRGVKGVFDRIAAGLEDIQRRKRERGLVRPHVVIVATVSKDNAHNLDEVFKMGEAMQVDGLIVFYGYFQTEESGRRHDVVMQEKLDTTPWSWRGWVWSYDEIDIEALVETVKRIKGNQYSFPYLFVPELSYEDVPRYYREHANTFGYGKCVAPWVSMEIMPNGDVATCRDYPDYVVGNIKEQSILDIWNNERYRKFRNVLKEETLLPICTRCYGLMDW